LATSTTDRSSVWHRRLLTAAGWLQWLLAVALVAAVVMNVCNVIGRYVFGRSIPGADELQIYLMVALAFLGAVVASVRGLHLRMDALKPYFSAGLRHALDRVEGLLATGLCGLVAVQSSLYAWRIFSLGSRSENAHIPMWLPHSVVAVGFTAMALVGLVYVLAGAPAADPGDSTVPP
jgi:C4-dicarboxylate transporter, DctQ subunit